jgi:hypothetical protein
MPVTVHLMGGIGNQLFQIAAGYALAKRFNTNFFLVEGNFHCGQGSHPSKYYDTVYRNFPRKALEGGAHIHNERRWTYYSIDSFEAPFHTTVQLKGYFQSERHFLGFKQELRNLFAPREFVLGYLESRGLQARHPELFEPHDYCLLGVRRGDYLKLPNFHNPCGMDYYSKAMALNPASKYYIISDDMAWCKSHFIGPMFVFIESVSDLDDFYLGTLFSKYIIGNSSFHWWISYLSLCEKPRVIAPDKWVFGNAPRSEYDTVYREDMIVVERLVEV